MIKNPTPCLLVIALISCSGAGFEAGLFTHTEGSDATNDAGAAGDSVAVDSAAPDSGQDAGQDAVVENSNPTQVEAGGADSLSDSAYRDAGSSACDPIFWCYGNDGGQAYCGRTQFESTTCGVIDCGACGSSELTCVNTHCRSTQCLSDPTIVAFCQKNGRPNTWWGYVRSGPRACTAGYMDENGQTLTPGQLTNCVGVGNFYCCDFS